MKTIYTVPALIIILTLLALFAGCTERSISTEIGVAVANSCNSQGMVARAVVTNSVSSVQCVKPETKPE